MVKSAIVLLLAFSEAWGQVPDSPSKVFSKPFIAAHAAFLGSVVYDVEMTHQGLAHHRCVEQNGNPYPSRGELYRNDLLFFAGLIAMDVGLKAIGNHNGFPRWMNETTGNIGAIIGTGKHVYGGTRWATECW